MTRFALLVACSLLLATCALGSPIAQRVWPLSGSAQPDSLRFPFGVRNFVGGGGVDFQFHRGVDLRTFGSTGLNVYAVDNGVVNATDSTSVLIEHTDWDSTESYYTYYEGMNTINVNAGDSITKRDVIGLSFNSLDGGSSSQNTLTVHFEVRRGSTDPRSAINPFTQMPYDPAASTYNQPLPSRTAGVTVNAGDFSYSYVIEVPTAQMDVNVIGFEERDENDAVLAQYVYDFVQLSADTTDTSNPPSVSGATVVPATVSTSNPQPYTYTISRFSLLNSNSRYVRSRTVDARGNVQVSAELDVMTGMQRVAPSTATTTTTSTTGMMPVTCATPQGRLEIIFDVSNNNGVNTTFVEEYVESSAADGVVRSVRPDPSQVNGELTFRVLTCTQAQADALANDLDSAILSSACSPACSSATVTGANASASLRASLLFLAFALFMGALLF